MKTNITMVFIQIQHKMLLITTAPSDSTPSWHASSALIFNHLSQAHAPMKGFISSSVPEIEHVPGLAGGLLRVTLIAC